MSGNFSKPVKKIGDFNSSWRHKPYKIQGKKNIIICNSIMFSHICTNVLLKIPDTQSFNQDP